MRKLILLSVLALAASVSTAETITTLFASNNSGSAGGGVYYDITVGALPLEIKSLTVNSNSAPGTPIAFEMWTRTGETWDGNHNSPVGWDLRAIGSGTAAGVDIPTAITLDETFVLDANTLYGTAIGLGPAAAHAYTNGNGQNQHFENNNLALDLGGATNALFGAGRFFPRVWNGSITYNKIPEPATLGLLVLGGLALLRRR